MEGSVNCSANYAPLTPITFLERSAIVYGGRVSIVYDHVQYTWSQTHRRCKSLASALSQFGVSRGDVVGALAPNIPEMYELHFGVPMAGGVLCTLNTRHDSSMLSVLLKHSQPKILFVDHQLLSVALAAVDILSRSTKTPLIVLIHPLHERTAEKKTVDVGESILEYETLLSKGSPDFETVKPRDELEPISLNYTSGTTSSPKGVIFSHRGAYLNSIAVILLSEMKPMPVYLWCVPMFHCNGWCLTWALAAQGGTSVCQRHVTAASIFSLVRRHRVTHMGGAPTVLNMLVNASEADRHQIGDRGSEGPLKSSPVSVMTGAAPPPPSVLFRMKELGFHIIHSYGLTETYGPATVCAWKPQWDSLDPEAQARLKARQGVNHMGLEVDIKNPETMESVAADGEKIGEVMFRGNTVMSGYLRDAVATREAFRGGWFRSGDLGVKHPDGYLELKDRSKDIIISGGENVSSIEVEAVLYGHPAVAEAAVVARPDDYWGETPCAFVKLKNGIIVSENEIIEFVRGRLPHYMAPRSVVFQDLPKTSTGKVQKFALRDKAKAMGTLFTNNKSKL